MGVRSCWRPWFDREQKSTPPLKHGMTHEGINAAFETKDDARRMTHVFLYIPFVYVVILLSCNTLRSHHVDQVHPRTHHSAMMFVRTALHFAAKNGHLSVIEELARLGAELNAVDEQENTPLHTAASLGNLGELRAWLLAGDIAIRYS